MALHKKEEAFCLELGSKDGLQRTYGNQALILRAWGRLEEPWRCSRKRKRSAWSWAQGRFAAQLRQPGLDPASLGPAGGGF